jgi:UDP-N-acetylmuramoyl-tripeptide--D-alanyl-D-alanine ligase
VSGWDAARVASAAGAQLLRGTAGATSAEAPPRAVVDTRALAPGELFVGLRGEREDGGARAGEALAAGAWGVLVSPERADALLSGASGQGGAVLSHPDPLAGLQALAGAWRGELGERGCAVVAVTGSTGKTSTKDILAALLGNSMATAASPANLNTEIGLPLAVLAAPPGTRALVLEMAMRGPGQIAELTAIAQPDVGVIVNVGPAHLELLGSLENIAAAKAELIAGLHPGASAVVPAQEPLLEAHLREDLETITFGEGGDVALIGLADPPGAGTRSGVRIALHGEEIELWPSFTQAHNLSNLLAAVAAASVLGPVPEGRLDVEFSAMRGQREQLPGDAVLIDDCYNANPMSMRAAIDELSATAPGRRVAVLGEMLELGPEGPALHRELGAHARAAGIDVLVTVGALGAQIGAGYGGATHELPDAQAAAAAVPALIQEGDTVLVKASRGVGLERVSDALRAAAPALAGLAGRPVPGQR